MFEDSLEESTRHISKRRGWTTLLSTSVQIALVAFPVILPLLRTSAISVRPTVMPVFRAYAPKPASEARRSPASGGPSIAPQAIQVELRSGRQSLHDREFAQESPPAVPICMIDCGGPDVPYSIGNTPSNFTLRRPERQKPQVISQLDPGQIIRRVEPVYPPLARIARIQGTVVMHAIISRDGMIERLQIVHSDHPMLDRPALDAVSQWRFKPYILNHEPIEVETEISVNFILAR